MLSHRFFSRRSEPAPDDIEAAQARLERVVASARSGWTPSAVNEGDGEFVALDDGPPAAGDRVGAHARPRSDRRILDGRALAALAVLAVLSLLIAAWYVWHSWPVAADVPARTEIVSAGSTASPGPEESAVPPTFPSVGAAPSPAPTTALVVHVAGSVVQPGIVTLPSGARVADAIQAAGGTLPETDTTGVNLARVLVDGEQVLVGVAAAVAAPTPGPGTPVSTQGAAGGPLDLNAATIDQLQDLPGLGPVLAQRIVDWRTAHGRFTTVDELHEVSGIGEQRLEDLRPLLRV